MQHLKHIHLVLPKGGRMLPKGYQFTIPKGLGGAQTWDRNGHHGGGERGDEIIECCINLNM